MMPIPPILFKLLPTALIAITGTAIFSLLLGSCTSSTSPGIKDIYLIRTLSPSAQNATYEVRTGYFGTCTGTPGNITCSSGAGGWGNSANNAPANIRPFVQLGTEVRHGVFFPYVEAVATGFFLAGAFLTLFNQIGIHSRGWMNQMTLFSLGMASFLSLLATIAIGSAREAMIFTSETLKGGAVVEGGQSMYIMHWVAFALCVLLLLVSLATALPGMGMAMITGIFRRSSKV